MLSISRLQENIAEFEKTIGRSADPVLILVQLANGVDYYGEELAKRLVDSGAIPATSPLLRELVEVPRDQRMTAANHSARYLYATGVQTQLTDAAGGPVRFDFTKLIGDPTFANAMQEIQMNLSSDEATKAADERT